MGEVALSVCAGALFLWVPGTLMLLAVRLERLMALALAPIASILGYSMLGALYGTAGIFTNWANVSLPILAICAIAYAVSRIEAHKRERNRRARATSRKDAILFVGYLAFGILIVFVVFVSNLYQPDSVLQEFDNVHHLGVLRSFLETGRWSFFDVSAYGGIDHDIRAIDAWGFYPTAWHLTGALLSSSLGTSVACAANATNALYAALVFPAGMFAMLRILFADRLAPMVCGIFLSFAFAAFPWKFMIWGPLFPNLSSYALMPGVIYAFLSVFARDATKADRITSGIVFGCGVVALAIAQTNAVFTMAVFLIPFVVLQASRIPLRHAGSKVALGLIGKRIAAGAIALVLIGIVWVICLLLPFLREVVTHAWPPIYTLPEALENTLLLSYNATQPQYLLAAILLMGIVYTIKHREYLWMSFSYAIMCLIFIVCATSSGIVKQAMGGFWYTDTMRLVASAALYAIPLCCLGLSWIIRIPALFLKDRAACNVIGGVVGAICIGIVFAPASPLSAALGTKGAIADIAQSVRAFYGPADENVYTEEEHRFVEQAQGITGDALVLNMPDDGSAFAYGIDGLDVFYRYTRTYGGDDETPESRLIRKHLVDITSDESVQDAVEAIDAEYVIKLDQGDQGVRKNRYLFTYDESLWEGIDSIDDSTPGLELVLSEDDMRLYRIIR